MKLNLAGKVKVLDSEYREDIVLKMSRLQCKWFFFFFSNISQNMGLFTVEHNFKQLARIEKYA